MSPIINDSNVTYCLFNGISDENQFIYGKYSNNSLFYDKFNAK